MPIVFPVNSFGEVGNKISATQHVIQTVHNVGTTSVATSSTSAVDLYTTATGITLTSASNKIIIDFHWENRANDWGDAVWNLYYMDLIHVGTATQLCYSGYNGEYTYCIRPFRRSYVHTPGSVGPHTYKVRGWCYQTSQTTFGGASAGGDGRYYIRMTEIAA
jgi:hypothetical protein